MNELALVGAPSQRQTPYWEQQARDIAWRYGEFERPLITDWIRTVKRTKRNGIREANQRLERLRGLFKIGSFLVSQTGDQYMQDYCTIQARANIQRLRGWSIDEIEKAARMLLPIMENHDFEAEVKDLKAIVGAFNVRKVISEYIKDENKIARHMGKYIKKIERLTPFVIGLTKRVQDEDWWRRKMRRKQAQRIEQISRELHQVVITKSAYCSKVGRREWGRRQQLNMDMLEHTLMENDDGEQYTLADLSETTVANPMIRRTELMVRIAGFEEYAKSKEFEGWFFTITCPSKYHAAYKTGNRNDKFRGYSPRECQAYLNKIWAQFRSKAQRETKDKPYRWEYFGFRVTEPHHDGTPHWHLLLFINPDHVEEVTEELKSLSEREDWQELVGLNEVRFKAEKIKTGINPKTGKEYSAAGYIAKYIAKNIDGEHVDTDLYGQDAKASAKDITAWASRNGIRQFQQVGGPKVTGWRELRKLANMPIEDWKFQEMPLFNFAQKLNAIAKDNAPAAWKLYCEYFDENGLKLLNVLNTITETLESIEETISELSGEIFTETVTQELTRPVINAYGETSEKMVGIITSINGQTIKKVSRTRTWTRVAANNEQAAAVRQQRKAERQAAAEARAEARAVAQATKSEAPQAAEQNGASAPPWTGVNNCTEPPTPITQTLFKDLIQTA